MSEQNHTIPLLAVPLLMNPAITCIRATWTLTPHEHQMHENILNELGTAFFCETSEESWKILRKVGTYAGEQNLVTETFLAMYTSLKAFVSWQDKESEYDMYPTFEDMLSTLIPGASLVPAPLKHSLRPDFFVEREEMVSPVEIKRGPFTNRAVKQLQRYMTVFNCVTGYAVAPTLRGTLLPGMMFIQWEGKA